MKHYLSSLALAFSLGIVIPAQANERSEQLISPQPFNFTLSQDKINPNYNPRKGCKKNCNIVQRNRSVSFWNNIITGADNANVELHLTPYTQKAARFLMQTTYGPTARDILELAQAIENEGEQAALERWVDEQIAVPSSKFTDLVANSTNHLQMNSWWQLSIASPDQLRQRLAFALNHIMTISWVGALTKDGTLVDYYDVLAKGGLGDYRQLLTDITYHIGMNIYLDNVHNTRGNRNENYARELMQLFTLGTERLNMNGTPQLDVKGRPIPTYSEEDVVELSKALSGLKRKKSWFGPATLKKKYHATGIKTLFKNTPEEVSFNSSPHGDIKHALDAIFNHPNTAPFISKRLIQHLVTSNPTPQYVERVAYVFADNGNGKRGDMAAVVRAILLDIEARDPSSVPEFQFYGKLKEPVLRYTNLVRAFKVDLGGNLIGNIRNVQQPMYAPSVFSFYQPDDTQVGAIEAANKVSPEFNLVTDVNQAYVRNGLYDLIFEQGNTWKTHKKGRFGHFYLEYEAQLALDNPAALVDRYNLLLMGGNMEASMKQTIVDFMHQIPEEHGGEERARKALFLVMSSSQQAIQR